MRKQNLALSKLQWLICRKKKKQKTKTKNKKQNKKTTKKNKQTKNNQPTSNIETVELWPKIDIRITWNHLTVCKWKVLNNNTWNYFILCKQIIKI